MQLQKTMIGPPSLNSREALSFGHGEVRTCEADPFERFEEAAKSLFKVSRKDMDKAQLRRKKEKDAREADKK